MAGQKETYEQKAEALVLPIIQENNCELVDVEYVKEAGNWYLRVYADKAGSITIDDCEAISRAFSAVLDREDFIPDAYILEVSSPGLGRQLKKEKDYERSIGEEVELKLYRPMDGRKEVFGILKEYTGEAFILEEDGELKTIPKSNTAVIRLALDF